MNPWLLLLAMWIVLGLLAFISWKVAAVAALIVAVIVAFFWIVGLRAVKDDERICAERRRTSGR